MSRPSRVDWAALRHRHLHGESLRELSAATGVTLGWLYQRANAEGWRQPKTLHGPRSGRPSGIASVQGLRRRCQVCRQILQDDGCQCGKGARA